METGRLRHISGPKNENEKSDNAPPPPVLPAGSPVYTQLVVIKHHGLSGLSWKPREEKASSDRIWEVRLEEPT